MATDSPASPTRAVRPAGSTPAVACDHCGLPVPTGLVDNHAERQFCCNGCRTVYELIHGCGLDRYYRLRDQAPGAVATRATGRSYESYDDPGFAERHCRPAPGGHMRTEFYLEGVHCAACVWLVERLPRVAPGVIEARLDIRRALVRVTWDPQVASLSRLASALDRLGYPPHPARDARTRLLRRNEDRRFLIRIAVAGAATGNVMTLAFALYGGTFSGIEAPHATLFRWVSMVLGLLALAWPGSVFFQGAWAALRTRTAHLDLPIALGLLVGGIAGTIHTVLGRGEVYFDSLTMLVFLLLVGRWLQLRQQRWSADAVELLFSMTPTSARRVDPDGIREVPIESLARTDLVEVRAGETIPADGDIENGDSSIDAAWLTGEPNPVSVGPGSRVYAGTINVSAPVRIRVLEAGTSTRAAGLMRLVEEGTRHRPPIVRFADRIAGWFTLVVIVLAAGTFLAWLAVDPSRAPDAAAALLIVSCPCALGLATPLAFTAAIGRAARRGILIKGGDCLETLAGRGSIFIDKTGTVTEGRVSLASWHGDAALRPVVAALERSCSHPVARALVSGLAGDTAAFAPDAVLEQAFRQGLVGRAGGQAITVGSSTFVRARAAHMPSELSEQEQALVEAGLTPVLVASGDRIVAVAGLGDAIRPDSAEAVRLCRELGWEASLLSGDHPRVARTVGARLGLPDSAITGGAAPEDKLQVIRAATARGPVVMVGDGVNDAAALSAATVGIAVHGGAEASLAAADVYLARPGLSPVIELLHVARGTVRAIRVSFAASLVYNLVAVGLAATGVITPLIAAVLMPLSSFTAAGIVTLRTGRPGANPGPVSGSGLHPPAAPAEVPACP
jgi:Cu2+-exporting ATPase